MYEKLRAQVLPGLIPPQAKMLMAVSGGPDSVALAHVLWRYARDEKERELELVISHINHGVRPESAQEEMLVQGLAEKWGIPCVSHAFDAKEYAKSSGRSFQEGARAWRYERWEQDMQELGCTHLATAHHLGDQAETVLYRLFRGSGTAGLAGILPSHNRVLRPLLSVTKEEILAYCAGEELPYALDRSNEEPVYVRNKIRLNLLPELAKEYNPQIVQALGRTAILMRWDEEYVQEKAEEIWRDNIIYSHNIIPADNPISWRYSKTAATDSAIDSAMGSDKVSAKEVCLNIRVLDQPPALVSRILRRAAAQVSGEPRGLGYDYIVRIMEQGISARAQGNLHWSQDFPGFQVEIKSEGILFRRSTHEQREKHAHDHGGRPGLRGEYEGKPTGMKVEIQLTEGTWADISELGIKVGIFTDYSQEVVDEVAVFDGETVLSFPEPLVCRTRRPGDKIYLKGVGHKSLKKVFQEEGIGMDRRESLPLIASGSEVLWIPGVKRSDAAPSRQNRGQLYCVLRSASSAEA